MNSSASLTWILTLLALVLALQSVYLLLPGTGHLFWAGMDKP